MTTFAYRGTYHHQVSVGLKILRALDSLCFVNLIYAPQHYLPEIKANGSLFIVDYVFAILKNFINFAIIQSGKAEVGKLEKF